LLRYLHASIGSVPMRHDKRPKLLSQPMTLSQALSRPWVQTRVLRRDQGIATCLGEFWSTALRCAPKEPPSYIRSCAQSYTPVNPT